MRLQERVYSTLVASSSQKLNDALAQLLPASTYQPVHIVTSAGAARRCLTEQSFDFVLVNLPLPDESGIRFAIDCCRSPSTVVLALLKSDVYAEVYDRALDHGIFTLVKPTSRLTLSQALNWMASAREKLRTLEKKTLSIEERMQEIRILNRAKFLLISELKLTEQDAHHYIEKYAMDNCISKKDAAQTIIKIYS